MPRKTREQIPEPEIEPEGAPEEVEEVEEVEPGVKTESILTKPKRILTENN